MKATPTIIEIRLRLRWTEETIPPSNGLKMILKILGRQFRAQCLECGLRTPNQDGGPNPTPGEDLRRIEG